MKWVILVLGILSNASASVLIKLALEPTRRPLSLTEPLTIVTNWPLWLGVILYGCAFLLYAVALSKFPLNVAHPVLTSGAIALVALFSMIIFREPFYWTTVLGIIFVLIGVFLITARVV
ncbi:MAG TPA: DMT family transporter [Arsenophonus nasoniae]|uniref:DMT family transporter n=1 Tax=Arsenophonus nasoniae TaxID=638 RepID=UPI00387A635A